MKPALCPAFALALALALAAASCKSPPRLEPRVILTDPEGAFILDVLGLRAEEPAVFMKVRRDER